MGWCPSRPYWSIFRPLTPQLLNSQPPLPGSGHSRPTTSILLNVLHFVLFLILGIFFFLNQTFCFLSFCILCKVMMCLFGAEKLI